MGMSTCVSIMDNGGEIPQNLKLGLPHYVAIPLKADEITWETVICFPLVYDTSIHNN